MLRIISGISENSEQEERTFNTKNHNILTSNFHPGHAVLNSTSSQTRI